MDKIASITGTAREGIERNLRDLGKAAHEIATAPVRRAEPTELADPLVQALVAERALEASAAVMHRADEAMGSLLRALGG
jgi:hypothetical protein